MKNEYKELIQKHLDDAYGVSLSLWESKNRVENRIVLKKIMEKIIESKRILEEDELKEEEENKEIRVEDLETSMVAQRELNEIRDIRIKRLQDEVAYLSAEVGNKDATKRRLHEQISTLAIKHEKLLESVIVLERKAEGKWSYDLKLSERVGDLEKEHVNSDRIKIKTMLIDASNKIEACLGWTHSMGDNEDLKETNQKLLDSVYAINDKISEVNAKRRKDG